MKLETIVVISAILLVLVLAGVYIYRKKNESFTMPVTQYEKLKNYSRDSWLQLIDLPPGVREKKIKENYLFEQETDLPTEMNSKFQKLNTAYNLQMMDLPPIKKSPRLLPVDQQPKDPYSGMPAALFKVDGNINKFYPEYVPDYLWCNEAVCG
jgi:hypothetical protein